MANWFITNVRFRSGLTYFAISAKLAYFLTRHDIFNAYFCVRYYHTSDECICEHRSEDWLHIVTEYQLCEENRILDGMGLENDRCELNFGFLLEFECCTQLCMPCVAILYV